MIKILIFNIECRETRNEDESEGANVYSIAIVNQKGGVGKTTSAVQLAAGLAERGYRVLACDMDAQANLTATALGEGALPKDAPTMYEVLVGEEGPESAIVAGARCDLLPAAQANKRLSILDAAIGDRPDKLFRLREALAKVSSAYDFAVIDTPPARDTLAYNALTAADGVLIPTVAGEYSLNAIGDLAESVDQTRRYTNPGLRILGVLITQHRASTRLGKGMAAGAREIAESLGTHVLPTEIREAVAIGESQARYTDIFDYAPRSGVAGDYRHMVDDVLEGVANAG